MKCFDLEIAIDLQVELLKLLKIQLKVMLEFMLLRLAERREGILSLKDHLNLAGLRRPTSQGRGKVPSGLKTQL